MKGNRILLLIGVAVALFLANTSTHAQTPVKGISPEYIGLGEFENPTQGFNMSTPQTNTNLNAPVIKSAYAVDRGIYGTILRIYVEAEDPKGEMTKIATTVDQVGYGHYPTDFIILKSEYRKYFKGYIQWNTFSSRAPNMHEWVKNYVTVAVMDKAGNVSNEFMFPFTFETGVGPSPKPPAPFDQGDLPKFGSISIELFDPFDGGGGDGNFQ